MTPFVQSAWAISENDTQLFYKNPLVRGRCEWKTDRHQFGNDGKFHQGFLL